MVEHGHQVYVEAGAGKTSNFKDIEYADVGGDIVDSPAELYRKCNLVVKVGPPCEEELDLLQEKQTLISALHLGNTTSEFLQRLMDLRITGIGFEFIRDPDGSYPIIRMMHEIMGSMAPNALPSCFRANVFVSAPN